MNRDDLAWQFDDGSFALPELVLNFILVDSLDVGLGTCLQLTFHVTQQELQFTGPVVRWC